MSLQLVVLDTGGLGYGETFKIIFGDPVPQTPPLHTQIVDGRSLILTWEGDFELYSTLDLGQPFELIPDASSPYQTDLVQMGFYLLKPKENPPAQEP